MICRVFHIVFGLVLGVQPVICQNWEGLGIGDIKSAYFNELVVDSVEDKLVLGGTSFLSSINGVSTSTVIKWTPENGVEILSPYDWSVMGVSTVQDIIFSHDSMIVVGAFGISIFKGGTWIYNNHNIQHGFQEILPYQNGYLLATGYSYFTPLGTYPQLLLWDGSSSFTEYEQITDVTKDSDGIFALVEFQNKLYVGGNGRSSNGSLMNGVMRWTGSKWDDLDGGITDVSKLGGITYMVVY
jgi:hypothetical protein